MEPVNNPAPEASANLRAADGPAANDEAVKRVSIVEEVQMEVLGASTRSHLNDGDSDANQVCSGEIPPGGVRWESLRLGTVVSDLDGYRSRAPNYPLPEMSG